MPPRIDPYSNKAHKRIDIALILITLVLLFIAFRLSAHDRASSDPRNNNAPAAQRGK
jgi:hypothetical protein